MNLKDINFSEPLTCADLALALGVKPSEVIKELMKLGVMATITQQIDPITALLAAYSIRENVTQKMMEGMETQISLLTTAIDKAGLKIQATPSAWTLQKEDGTPARPPTVPELLRAAADTYEQRNRLYGDNYKRFGEIMLALLPNGIHLDTKEDWSRFGVFFHAVGKITRYAANINTGGHSDSAHDLSVYAAMLEELTQEREG